MRARVRMIYLASPHSHLDASVREARYIGVVEAAAKLEMAGHMVFCPIAHSHMISVMQMAHGGKPPNWKYYEEFDSKILSVCSELWVLKLEGWEDSTGIKAEIVLAKKRNMMIKYVDPEELKWPTPSTTS